MFTLTNEKPDATNETDESTEQMSSKEGKSSPAAENHYHTGSSDWSELEGFCFKDFSGKGGKERTSQFLRALSEILTSYVLWERDPTAKVLDFHHPHQLKEMMSHCLDIHPEPRDLEQLLSDCKETLKYCVKTGHPHFFNQLSTGIDVVGMAGSWLTAAANTNLFTYEVAPVFTLMEEIIWKHMIKLIGWEEGEGIFAPGGALSNLYGVLLARHHALPDAKQSGMRGVQTPVVLTSAQSHFSIKRAGAILGIGTNNVISVACHGNGKMNVEDLRDKILASKRSGQIVLMVNATCGTTVLGAFDPLHEIADLCEEHGIWLHVDAAWGGGVLLSRDHRHLIDGIYRTDSITWNPHKMMGVPLQCSVFLTKRKGLMKDCNTMGATYLFQKDKNYDVTYDTGDRTIQCGRHNDIFKLWLMWRAKGDLGFEEQMNKNFHLAAYLRDKVKERPGFHLVLEKIEAPNVCFWYVPPAWRTCPLAKINSSDLMKVAPIIKTKMMEAGNLLVQYQPLGDQPNFFRIAISNPILTPRDLDFALDEIDFLGHEIPVPLDWDAE